MGSRSAGSYAVATVTCVAAGFPSCLQFMSLPVLMKETMLCYSYRSGLRFQAMNYDNDLYQTPRHGQDARRSLHTTSIETSRFLHSSLDSRLFLT